MRFIMRSWLLGDPTDLWRRRGVLPGHEDRETLGRLQELGVDWRGPTSHSCPTCEDPAAFAEAARGREWGSGHRQRKLGSVDNKTKHWTEQTEKDLSSATLGERSVGDRYVNKSSFLANCVTTNKCKLIRDTKSLVTGSVAQEELTPVGHWH